MNFRELRESRKLTQFELAQLCHGEVQQATISQIENGVVRDPRYSTIRALADALGVTTEVVARCIRETEAA